MLTQEQLDAIPREVRERRQWLPWRWELDAEPGKKPDKVLVDPRDKRDHKDSKYYAQWKNSDRWLGFDEAVAAMRAENLEGVGYVFAKNDPFAGLDFDHCWEPETRTIEAWADGLIPKHTYCEVSPSGTGIKCLGYGRVPDDKGRIKKVQALLGAPHPKAEIGCYSAGRWFAFTGLALNGSRVREMQSAIDRLLGEVFDPPPGPGDSAPISEPKTNASANIRDAELIRKIVASNEGEKFLKLYYEGDASAYPSASEADLALCAILAFWAGRDSERVLRMFNASALGKAKRLKVGEAKRTAEKACATAKSVWTPSVIAATNYDIRPIAELLAKDFGAEKFVMEGRLPVGGTSILASKPKVGKTTLTRQLIVAVARGERFLECEVMRGPAVLLSFQGREADIARHFKLLGATPDDPIFYHCGRPPAGAIEKLYELADKYRPVLIVVEMLQHLIRVRNTNDYAEVSLAMEPVEDIARQSSAHILLTTHFGKTDRDDPADQIMGSTGFRGVVDTSIMLRRYSEHRTIATEQRIGTDLAESVLKWNEEQQSIYLGEARAPLLRFDDEEKILVALRASEKPMTKSEIAETVHMNRGKVFAALERIEKYKSRQIFRTGSGVRKDPVRFAANPDYRNVVAFPGGDS